MAGGSGPESQGRTIKIDELPAEQLQHLSGQLQQEISKLQGSANMISGIGTEWLHSKLAIEEIADVPEGSQLLVPMTEGLYVTGTAHNTGQVLVELGTGYYAERDCKSAADFCQRKMDFVRERLDDIGSQLAGKQQVFSAVQQVLTRKAQQSQQEFEGP